MTQEELAGTGNFQGLFQFTFEEVLRKQLGRTDDVNFSEPVDFTFPETGDPHAGRFAGKVEVPDGASGVTTGKFRLHLSHGLDGDDVCALLDDSALEIEIEAFPGG